MDRREFLHKSAVVLSGLSLTPLSSWPATIRPTTEAPPFASLGVLTDRPQAALQLFQEMLARVLTLHPGVPALRVRTFEVPGRHVADVVLIRPSGVVDVRRAKGTLPRAIRRCSSALALPKVVDDPTYLEFSSGLATQGPRRLRIARDQELLATPALDGETRALTVDTPLGAVVIHVGAGRARIVSAPCRHQTCVHMGSIDRSGQRLVCVPCRVSLSIAGGGDGSLDAITG